MHTLGCRSDSTHLSHNHQAWKSCHWNASPLCPAQMQTMQRSAIVFGQTCPEYRTYKVQVKSRQIFICSFICCVIWASSAVSCWSGRFHDPFKCWSIHLNPILLNRRVCVQKSSRMRPCFLRQVVAQLGSQWSSSKLVAVCQLTSFSTHVTVSATGSADCFLNNRHISKCEMSNNVWRSNHLWDT